MKSVVYALVALMVSEVAVLAIGTDLDTTIRGERFIVAESTCAFAVVAVGSVELAGNAAGLAGLADIVECVAKITDN